MLLQPRTAQAQDVYAEAEGGANFFVSGPQTSLYGLGFYGSARVGAWFTGALGFHLQLGYANWSASATAVDPNTGLPLAAGTLTTLGAGIRIAPEISRDLGRIFVDVEGAYGLTGGSGNARVAFDVGLGWLFPLADVFALGPVVRYNQVISTDGDIGDARFITLGVAIAFPGRRAIPPPPPEPPPPPPDTDHDGILDPDDQCPNLPAGPHPDPTRPGCPMGDRDHDGVFDDIDQCPDLPAGDPNRPGCPVAVAAPAACPDVPPPTPVATPAPIPAPSGPAAIVNGHIRIDEPVFFDTGLATIQARSYPILNAVAQVMVGHPEILTIRIEGHTDNVGRARRNLSLSRDRATAVATYLTDHGVSANRMRTAGFGSTRPLEQGDSETARDHNRRVEFVITNGPGAATNVASEPEEGHHHGHHGGGHHRHGHH